MAIPHGTPPRLVDREMGGTDEIKYPWWTKPRYQQRLTQVGGSVRTLRPHR